MEWIVDNWILIVTFAAVAANLFLTIRGYAGLPTEEQIAKVKEWLLYAVAEAEKEMGSGTGKLKLRWVYDWFVGRFPWMAKAVAFETFSGWVDDALEKMRHLLETNAAVAGFVGGDSE